MSVPILNIGSKKGNPFVYNIDVKELIYCDKPSIRYSENLKKTIVKLYREEKRSASSLANEYGVIVSTITKWIHQYQEISLPNGKVITAKEYVRLEKENRELKEELEILKQVAVLLENP